MDSNTTDKKLVRTLSQARTYFPQGWSDQYGTKATEKIDRILHELSGDYTPKKLYGGSPASREDEIPSCVEYFRPGLFYNKKKQEPQLSAETRKLGQKLMREQDNEDMASIEFKTK